MMQAMPKIPPAPRAYLDGLDIDDPATGAHYAAMLEAKILEEGPDTVLGLHPGTGRRRLHRCADAAGGVHAGDPRDL